MSTHCHENDTYHMKMLLSFVWESCVLFDHLMLQFRQKCIKDEKLYLLHSLESKMTEFCPIQVLKLISLMKNIFHIFKANKRCLYTRLHVWSTDMYVISSSTSPMCLIWNINAAATHRTENCSGGCHRSCKIRYKYLFNSNTHLNYVKQTWNSKQCTFF